MKVRDVISEDQFICQCRRRRGTLDVSYDMDSWLRGTRMSLGVRSNIDVDK